LKKAKLLNKNAGKKTVLEKNELIILVSICNEMRIDHPVLWDIIQDEFKTMLNNEKDTFTLE